MTTEKKNFWMREIDGTFQEPHHLDHKDTPHWYSKMGTCEAECPTCKNVVRLSLECLPITCSHCDTIGWQPFTSADIPALFDEIQDEELPQ